MADKQRADEQTADRQENRQTDRQAGRQTRACEKSPESASSSTRCRAGRKQTDRKQTEGRQTEGKQTEGRKTDRLVPVKSRPSRLAPAPGVGHCPR